MVIVPMTHIGSDSSLPLPGPQVHTLEPVPSLADQGPSGKSDSGASASDAVLPPGPSHHLIFPCPNPYLFYPSVYPARPLSLSSNSVT